MVLKSAIALGVCGGTSSAAVAQLAEVLCGRGFESLLSLIPGFECCIIELNGH